MWREWDACNRGLLSTVGRDADWRYDLYMNFTSRKVAAAAAITAAVTLGPALGTASAKPARASAVAVKDLNILVTSDGSDAGYYVWDAQLDKDFTDPAYYDISVLSGSTRFTWTWPSGGGSSHNVKLKTGSNFFTGKPFSTPGVSFFGTKGSGSPFTNNTGEDFTWPTKANGGVDGWVPTKAGTYHLICSQHSAMYMRVIVKGLIAKAKTSTRRGTVKAGTKALTTAVTANAASTASVRLVACSNRSCSKVKGIATKTSTLRKGSNGVKLSLRRGLKPGRYQVQVVSNGNVVKASAFVVR